MNPLTPLAIFIGSALLFCLQPMVGRTLLPSFGGSAAVWSVCLATFQALLVGGYAYAHALSSMDARKQRRVHIVALALAVAWAFAIALAGLAWARGNLHGGAYPALQVLLVVLLGAGVPYLVLSAGSSLLQSWAGAHAGQQGRAVYRLYAVSNLGSFIGLFAYPFLLEPFVPLHLQWAGWSAALAVYLLLVAGIATRKTTPALAGQRDLGDPDYLADLSDRSDRADQSDLSDLSDQPAAKNSAAASATAPHMPRALSGAAWWYILPGISSFMLVATTNHLSMDVAPVPLLWAVLLGAFLLSYVAGFSHAGERLLPVWRVLALVALVWSGYVAQTEGGGESFLPSVSAGMAFVFFGGTFLHSWLYSTRPEGARLTRFYLGVAVGGAVGGMLVSFVAPLVFRGVWEYPVALVVCALAALFFAACSWRREFASRALNWVAVVEIGVALIALGEYYLRKWLYVDLGFSPSAVWICAVALGVCVLAGLFFVARAWRRQIETSAHNLFAIVTSAAAFAVCVYLLRGDVLTWIHSKWSADGVVVSFFETLLLSWGAREIPIAVALGVCALAGLFFAGNSWRTRNMPRVFKGLAALACVWVCMLTWTALSSQGVGIVLRQRNFYGSLRVEESKLASGGEAARIFSLYNGGTMHGLQVRYKQGEEGRFADAPTSYYAPLGGGLSLSFSPKWRGAAPEKLVLSELAQFERPEGKPMRVAIIGLGTGSMVTWARKGDDWTYYEINPLVDNVARDRRFFTYLEDSPATVCTKLGDARLLLERERSEGAPLYDVLVADAYTGDSVPMQLATEEAFRLYADRLAPDGVLVIHISNWHLDLLPLCKAVGRTLGMTPVGVQADGNDYDLSESTLWVFLTRKPVKVDASGSGADLVDFARVRDIRLPTDDWGGLQSLIRFNADTPLLDNGNGE